MEESESLENHRFWELALKGGGQFYCRVDAYSVLCILYALHGLFMECIPSAEFQRNIGLYQDKELTEPVMVMRHGRAWVVLLSAAEFTRLKSLDREVLSVGELAEEELHAIAGAEVPAEYAALNQELTT